MKCVTELSQQVEELAHKLKKSRLERDEARKERDASLTCLQDMDRIVAQRDDANEANAKLTAQLEQAQNDLNVARTAAVKNSANSALLHQVMQERDIALAERDAAERSASRAERDAEFLEDKLVIANTQLEHLQLERNRLSEERAPTDDLQRSLALANVTIHRLEGECDRLSAERLRMVQARAVVALHADAGKRSESETGIAEDMQKFITLAESGPGLTDMLDRKVDQDWRTTESFIQGWLVGAGVIGDHAPVQ